MTLCEELYFEITLKGKRPAINKFITFLKSGELDEFFDFSSDYIHYDDDYESVSINDNTTVILSNDDYGIEIDEFDTAEFLEVFCYAGKDIFIQGTLYDIYDEEYAFNSMEGDSYYVNAKRSLSFNDDINEEDEDEEERYY